MSLLSVLSSYFLVKSKGKLGPSMNTMETYQRLKMSDH
jgi:hypothetical protein